MNVNDFGHVSIVFEYDMMCACVYRVKRFNFSNIRIRIRTDFYIKIRIRRMRILINSVTSLFVSTRDYYLWHSVVVSALALINVVNRHWTQ